MIKKWQKIRTQESYQCGMFYRVDKDQVVTPGGKNSTYYVVRKSPVVTIIAIDQDGYFYLTRQHRYAVNRFSLEFISGGSENGTILASAKRELEEEAQLTSKKWKKIACFDEANGISDIKTYVFIAENVTKKIVAKKDPLDENLHETKKVTYADLRTLIATNKIMDSLSLAAFAIAEVKGYFNKYKY